MNRVLELRPMGIVVLVLVLLGVAGCCQVNDDLGCPADLTCNMASSIGTIGMCMYPGEVNDPCDEDEDCAAGLECEWESSWTCKVPTGGSCDENEDCYHYHPPLRRGTCVFEECVQPAASREPCDDDDDCWGGLTCHPSGQICV